MGNEVKTVKVVLGGREFEVWPGYTMATMHAESDAGEYPRPKDIEKPTQAEITAHALWSERLVASYFNLPLDERGQCQYLAKVGPDLVMLAAGAIQQAKLLDPFGNPLPREAAEPAAEKPTPESPANPPPTIGS